MHTRRTFLKSASGLVAAGAWMPPIASASASKASASPAASPICVFSKHLQWLDYDEMAGVVATIGFDGVDLTVRPRGHVDPGRVEDELPRAVEAVQQAGLSVPMMTTAITDPSDKATERILETASALGIGYYRMGYLGYDDDRGVKASLDAHKSRLKELAAMNETFGIHGAYQNHSGTRVGGPVWDIWYLLDGLDPAWIGCQYDIRHATVEGGESWPLGLELLAPYIKITAIKDFYWRKDGDRWRIENVPLGDGMVDFKRYFDRVGRLDIQGPVSLHYEYDLPHEGTLSRSERVKKETIEVMKRDLSRLKDMADSY